MNPTNNRVQRGRLKIAKPKIVDSCELGDISNVYTIKMSQLKRGDFISVTFPPEL